MSGNSFTFKQFVIQQERCAMKVGTDGVLLGAWAQGGTRILDIGTGTALMALMLAQRFPDAYVTGIDIDGEACQQARENVANTPFADRVEVVHQALQAFMPQEGGVYDSIVSNPPYFHNSLKNPDERRAQARHTDALPINALFVHARRLLMPTGTLSIIVPTDNAELYLSEGYLHGFSLCRRCDVRTTPRKMPRRSLLAFALTHGHTVERQEAVLQAADGSRTPWYAALTADFYIR